MDTRPALSWRWGLLLLLLVAGCWAWAFPGVYLFDDFAIPLGDGACRDLGAWWHRGPFQLRVLTKLSFGLESTLGLSSASARRVTSLSIHLAGVFLLWRVLVERWKLSAKAGFLLALVYGIHPIHAESILALAGRSGALATSLLLSAVWVHDRRQGWPRLLLLSLAVLARETALAGAIAVLVFDASPDCPWRPRVVRAGGLAVLASVWMALGPRYRELFDYSFFGRPWATSTVAQIAAIPYGLSLYVRAWALTGDHGEALPTRVGHPLFLAGSALLVSAVILLWCTRRDRHVALPLALWLAAILPTQTVIPKLDPLTERPLAAALSGLILLLATLLVRLPLPRRLLGPTALAVVAFLACTCVPRARLYRSELAFWADAARKSTVSTRPLVNYATVLMEHDRFAEARLVLEQARQRSPLDPLVQSKRRYLKLREMPAPGPAHPRQELMGSEAEKRDQ